jgi:DNA gyrase inhibitor GyrI
MMLFGPGVMEETKANDINGASGSSISMGISFSDPHVSSPDQYSTDTVIRKAASPVLVK